VLAPESGFARLRSRRNGEAGNRDVARLLRKSKDDPTMLQSGIERAEAMAYRDARNCAMTEADWSNIETQLLRAYRPLKTSVAKDG
jgi:hypothetical protein